MTRRGWSPLRVYLCSLAILWVGWIGIAGWVVPWLIRKAYRGEALPFFNQFVTGQSLHPVAGYLAEWQRLAFFASAALGAASGTAFLLVRFWRRVHDSLLSLASRLPALQDRDLLVAAVSLGILSGLAEAFRAGVSYWVFHQAAGEWVTGEVYWMAPVMACVSLGLIAVMLVSLRRVLRLTDGANGAALYLLAGLCFYGLGRTFRLGIHPAAVLVLSLGLAGLIVRLAIHQPDSFRRGSRRIAAAGALAIALWGGTQPYRTARHDQARAASPGRLPATDHPNILLLVWDTMRARSLSLYGYPRQTSAHLDSFALKAVVFDAAIATAPWTLPSHASLLTGRYHHEHSADRNSPLDARVPTLAEVLRRAGYRTGGFVANTYWLGRGFGLDRGFDWYEDHPHVSAEAVVAAWWVSRSLQSLVKSLAHNHRSAFRLSAESIQQAFLRWADRSDTRPFFAFLNVFDAHAPFRPPGSFGFRFSARAPRYWYDFATPAEHGAAELQELRDAYDSCIYYVDTQFGVLLRQLEQRGLLSNTIVIVTSDHGETLGEHRPDLLGHENNVYDDVLNVPLVIYYPGLRPGAARHPELVTLADLPATILDLAGVANPAHAIPGNSVFHPPTSAADSVRPILSQANPAPWHKRGTAWPISKGPLFSLMKDRLHYIVNAAREEQLFDVVADRWESTDLAHTAAGQRALPEFRAELHRLHLAGF